MPALITIINNTRAALLLAAVTLFAVREVRAAWPQPHASPAANPIISISGVDVTHDCRAVPGGSANFTIDCSPAWSVNKAVWGAADIWTPEL